MEERQPEMLWGFSVLPSQSTLLGNTCCLLQTVHTSVSFCTICRDTFLCPKTWGIWGTARAIV